MYAKPKKGANCKGDKLCSAYFTWEGSPVKVDMGDGEERSFSKFASESQMADGVCSKLLEWDGDVSI